MVTYGISCESCILIICELKEGNNEIQKSVGDFYGVRQCPPNRY